MPRDRFREPDRDGLIHGVVLQAVLPRAAFGANSDVRYGSLADIVTGPRHVRFTPRSGRALVGIKVRLVRTAEALSVGQENMSGWQALGRGARLREARSINCGEQFSQVSGKSRSAPCGYQLDCLFQ
jgi:hypothetical protein